MIKEKLLEIKEYKGEGYQPLIDFDKWRVAILNYIDELLPENISNMQRHDETDEVFVLLKGRCILFIAEGEEKIGNIYAQDLEPFRMYNVKKSVWHNHTLSPDAMVLIVENRDTVEENSPVKNLNEKQKKHIVNIVQSNWGKNN